MKKTRFKKGSIFDLNITGGIISIKKTNPQDSSKKQAN